MRAAKSRLSRTDLFPQRPSWRVPQAGAQSKPMHRTSEGKLGECCGHQGHRWEGLARKARRQTQGGGGHISSYGDYFSEQRIRWSPREPTEMWKLRDTDIPNKSAHQRRGNNLKPDAHLLLESLLSCPSPEKPPLSWRVSFSALFH